MNIDIVRLLNDYSIPYTQPDGNKVFPGWVGIHCPLCGHSGWYGGFNLNNGYYSCWNCGGASMSWVLSQLLSIGVPQAKELMNSYWGSSSGLQLPGSGPNRSGTATHVELPGGDLKPIHKKYLKKRGFDPGYLEDRYHIRGTISGDYKYRIIIPIYNRVGRLISYQGRTVIDSPVKYKGARLDESVSHYKHALYNINNCEGSGILVVEGVFDVWRLGDGAVCTFGTSVPDQQVKEMAAFDRIFLLFDPEPEAQKKARKIALKLASLRKEVEMISLSSGDPADMSFSEVVRMKKELGVG